MQCWKTRCFLIFVCVFRVGQSFQHPINAAFLFVCVWLWGTPTCWYDWRYNENKSRTFEIRTPKCSIENYMCLISIKMKWDFHPDSISFRPLMRFITETLLKIRTPCWPTSQKVSPTLTLGRWTKRVKKNEELKEMVEKKTLKMIKLQKVIRK